MSAPTGNFRGQRTQSSSNGYKTIGSSIASGNNGGAFKRIFINALGNSNGNYDLALTKTLGIPRHYYNSTSNNSNYQQPSLSGKRLSVTTSPTAETLTQVNQTATVGFARPPPIPSCQNDLAVSSFTINNGITTITGSIYLSNGQYYAYIDTPIYGSIPVNIIGNSFTNCIAVTDYPINSEYTQGSFGPNSSACSNNGISTDISLTFSNNSATCQGNFVTITGTINQT